jgi:predicted ATPase/DNA-binding CsgD family transcriptional regulator
MKRTNIVPSSQKEQASKHNLPAQPTPLIGREEEVQAASTLLRRPDMRLLTLAGTAGIGKTRLALQVATELLQDFADGVSFVPLASIIDPDLVVLAIAQTLRIGETGTRPLLDLLQASLRNKQVLLLLDNFEQVVTAAPLVAELLEACPELKMLVTSREVLRLRAERRFPVPPLALPDPQHLPDIEALSRYASVALFLERAQALKSDFALSPANAPVIAEICRRLNGLPLAIELAAARVTLFSPQALLARLDRRLQVLTRGSHDLPERQQSLRNAIKWSYDLLSPEEQRLFRRLSVFVGGSTLEAVEAVCAALGDAMGSVWDGVSSLIDKSLLQYTEQEGEEPRLFMLEALREYGLEVLAVSGEMETAQQTHAAYYLRLSEGVEPKLDGPQQVVLLEQLEREHNNLRAAMRWSLEQGETRHSMEMALRLGGALRWFWLVRGYFSEGRNFLQRALAGSEGIAPSVQAKAFDAAARLAGIQGDHDQKELLCKQSLALYQQLGDKLGMAHAFYLLGGESQDWGGAPRKREDIAASRARTEEALKLFKEVGFREGAAWSLLRLARLTRRQGEYARAGVLFEENLALHRTLRNERGIGASLFHLAEALFVSQGNPATVGALIEESLALSKELGDKEGIAASFFLLGELALVQADAATACSLLEESVALCREMGHQDGLAQSLSALARVEARQDDYAAACALYEESLAICRVLDDQEGVAACLEGLAGAVAVQGSVGASIGGKEAWGASALGAALLWGAAEALRETIGVAIPPVWRADHERSVAAVRTHLGEKAFAATWDEGRAMTPEQALAAQRRAPMPAEQPTAPPAKSAISYPAGLSARQVEILRLVAQGLTDAQVADRLVLSRYTVSTHLHSIYTKLGVNSRTAATRFAVERHLV